MIEDNLYKYLSLYSRLPSGLKTITGKAYSSLPLSLRYGNKYKAFEQLIKMEKQASPEEIQKFQLDMLNKILSYAIAHVEYYRMRKSDYDIRINNKNDFIKIPFIYKKNIREHSDDFISDEFHKSDLIPLSTGGSTAEPLLLYYEKGVVRTKEFVYLNDQFGRIGYKPGDLLAVFRSALIRGRENSRLWEYEPVKNRWIYSTYDLTKKNIPLILEHLRKVKPKFLHVYPSALQIIAGCMKNNHVQPVESIKGILSGSENTFPEQIKLFEEVFNCPVFRWYGLGELSALAGSCKHSHNYHCYNTYSYVELIDENGNEVSQPGKSGEIVGTSFDNFSMPLIRYRTGDYAVYAGSSCPHCGYNGLLFREILGREQEKIIDKNKNEISLGPIIFGIHDEFWAKIDAVQFVQEVPGRLKILASSNSLNHAETERLIRKIFQPRLKNNFTFKIEAVDKITRTGSGKHKFLINKLSP